MFSGGIETRHWPEMGQIMYIILALTSICYILLLDTPTIFQWLKQWKTADHKLFNECLEKLSETSNLWKKWNKHDYRFNYHQRIARESKEKEFFYW